MPVRSNAGWWLASAMLFAACAADRVDGGDEPGGEDAGTSSSSSSGGASSGAGTASVEPAALEEGELRPGGDTTTDRVDHLAFAQRAENLPLSGWQAFETGLQFFRLEWLAPPAEASIDGLGPMFHESSCVGCHPFNGRAAPQRTASDRSSGVMLRIGAADGSPDPVYGHQLQPSGVAQVPGEARVHRHEEQVTYTLADGSTEVLTVPRYELSELGYGPLAESTVFSPRIAPQLPGLGLLDAIAEADLLAKVDEHDADGDGVSGRAQWVERGGERRLGRFGWKAGQPDVVWQTAAAFVEDLGITSPLFPNESCTESQAACLASPNGGSPELTTGRLRDTATYVRLLAVPARRDGEALDVRRGKTLFSQFGCQSCHTPSYVTSDALRPELAGQRIWPYTDLLLHDMGERLADGRVEGEASGREWRTPPLWGIGLVRTANADATLLHDGRAKDVHQAILWHGGEADRAREAYERAPAEQRAWLRRFVESL